MESQNPFNHETTRPSDSSKDLVAEANHRVANSLALLGGLVRMQARAIGKNSQTYSNAEIRLMFDGIAARIATIGQLHRMLAAHARRRHHCPERASARSLRQSDHRLFVRTAAGSHRS